MKIMMSRLSNYYSRERKKEEALRSNSGACSGGLRCGNIEGKIVHGDFKLRGKNEKIDIVL